MNTQGHEDVAKAAGLPLLEEAFGKDKCSLQAFYLGNWLTDVSQAVDPVAYGTGSGKGKDAVNKIVDGVKQAIDGLIDEVLATTYDWFDVSEGSQVERVLKSLKPDLKPYADEAKKALHGQINFFLSIQTNERDSRLAEFFRSAFLVVGYYKFVHPNAPGQSPRMNFECFMRVFGRPNDTRGAAGSSPANDRPGAYTQYYPHEHLDRPEILPPETPPIFAPGQQTIARPFRVARGKKTGTRSPRRRERIEPDLYSYLRDDIEMTAGLLAEIDLAFENAFAEGIQDNDPNWHITLAKLGHALHMVEDFFAHSNWVELAAKRLGSGFLSKAIPAVSPVEFLNRAYTAYQKRLKRHLTIPLDDWHKHPDEDWVVTGYFDFQDTLISLAHISEELWGGHVPDPYAAGHDLYEAAKEKVQLPRTVLYQAQKVMQETLDFLTDPERALEDCENSVAQSLKNKFEPDLNKLRRPGVSRKVAEQVAREVSLFHSAPKEVQDAFFNVIIEGSRAYQIGTLTLSIYQTIREIAEFIKNPIGWLLDWLPGWLRQKVKDALKFYAKERVYDWIGAGRIGCHSLLAKDHGLEPFYEHQKNCAIAVHWYIVKTLLRWSSLESKGYVDWVELLEYFLRNPLPPDNSSYREVRAFIPVTLIHTVAEGEQLAAKNSRDSLEAIYKRTAFDPARFTWRTIADANFGTASLPLKQAQRVINQTLRDNAWGLPVRPPNYAFKAGLRVLIPNQKALAIFRLPAGDDPTWFKEVMENDWKVFTGYEDPKSGTCVPPLEHHTPIMISRDQLGQLIQRGKKLRRTAREAYRPQQRNAK